MSKQSRRCKSEALAAVHETAQFWLDLQAARDIRVAASRAGREIASLPTRRPAPAAERPKRRASR